VSHVNGSRHGPVEAVSVQGDGRCRSRPGSPWDPVDTGGRIIGPYHDGGIRGHPAGPVLGQVPDPVSRLGQSRGLSGTRVRDGLAGACWRCACSEAIDHRDDQDAEGLGAGVRRGPGENLLRFRPLERESGERERAEKVGSESGEKQRRERAVVLAYALG
jgi:hypothetical protein